MVRDYHRKEGRFIVTMNHRDAMSPPGYTDTFYQLHEDRGVGGHALLGQFTIDELRDLQALLSRHMAAFMQHHKNYNGVREAAKAE